MTTMSRWYTNPELLRAAKEKYGTFAAIEQNIGGADRTTLALWWRKMGMEKLPRGPRPEIAQNEDALKRLYETVYG